MASSILLVGNSQLFAAMNNNNGGSTKEKTECLLEMSSDCRIEFGVNPLMCRQLELLKQNTLILAKMQSFLLVGRMIKFLQKMRRKTKMIHAMKRRQQSQAVAVHFAHMFTSWYT